MLKPNLLTSTFRSLTLLSLRTIAIEAKKTPNPNFLMFIPDGKAVMESGTMDFASLKYAYVSPLAKKLFELEGVARVFYGRDHIAVSKKEELDWDSLKPKIIKLISDSYDNKEPLFTDTPITKDSGDIKEDDSEVVIAIKEILQTRVRPVVQEDGGDITYRDFDEETGIVKLNMKGSCAGCPSSGATLKQGIERMLTFYIPEVISVEAVDYEGE